MSYYIGLDSGGTKTETVLVDHTGHIVSRTIRCGCNPIDVGVATAKETLLACIQELQAGAPGPVVSVYAGVAGVNRVHLDLNDVLEKECGIPHVCLEDDRRIVLSGTIGHIDGCGLICGTGSSMSIIKEGQPIVQVGGLGYLIDTCGSGFELGQAGLKMAFRYLDGRGAYTVLPELIQTALGKKLADSFDDIYCGGRPFIASLAHCVFDGMEQGDEVSRSIVEDAARSLGELTLVAEKHFDGVFPVVMSGGILHAYPNYVALIRKAAAPRANMILATAPPVYGAVSEAMWRAGEAVTERVRDTFMADYRAAQRQ